MKPQMFPFLLALAACGSGGSDTVQPIGPDTPQAPGPEAPQAPGPEAPQVVEIDITRSGFFQPINGFIPLNLVNQQNQGTTMPFGSASYTTGFDSSGAVAYSGLEDLRDVGAMPLSKINFSARWEVIGIDGVISSATSATGMNFYDGGGFALEFNPADNSLTGSGVGARARLSVDGTVSAGRIGGGVTYDGLSGDIDGTLGVNGLIGAFHGNSDTVVYSGGIRSD